MITPGLYEHYKGDLYLVIGEADDSTNGRHVPLVQVIYFSLRKRTLHRRDSAQFSELVQWPNGAMGARFQRVEPAPPTVEEAGR
jgi:hypothetical protein